MNRGTILKTQLSPRKVESTAGGNAHRYGCASCALHRAPSKGAPCHGIHVDLHIYYDIFPAITVKCPQEGYLFLIHIKVSYG